MIPYAKFFARDRVKRSTCLYAWSTTTLTCAAPAPVKPARSRIAFGRSSHQYHRSLPREPHPRRLRPLREDVPASGLERFERREPSARKEPDGAAETPADARAQELARAQESGGTLGLEPEQRTQVVARTVERRVAERAPVLRRDRKGVV